MRVLPKLTLNQRLGVLALALGALAVFANVAPGHTVTVNAKELLTSVARAEDHVTPAELAAWIIEGRPTTASSTSGTRRPSPSTTSHGENVPLATVTDGALGRTDRIVLYGDGGIHAAQAWMVLKGKGYTQVYTLLEGLDAWKDEVLFPVMPQSPTPEEKARFERAAQVAKFFGGQPRAAAAPGSEPMALPTQAAAPGVAPPTLPAGAATGRRRSAKAADQQGLRPLIRTRRLRRKDLRQPVPRCGLGSRGHLCASRGPQLGRLRGETVPATNDHDRRWFP